jgi:RNA polymerase sigma factor (sigma-70 family)
LTGHLEESCEVNPPHDDGSDAGLDWAKLANIAYHAAYRILRCHDDAQDIAGKTMASLVGRKCRPDNPEGWVTVVAKNLALDLCERKEIELTVNEECARRASDTLRDVAEQVVISVMLWDAMGTLSPRQRKCVKLVYLYGYDRQTVAEMLGICRETVDEHLERGMRKLRAYFCEGDR